MTTMPMRIETPRLELIAATDVLSCLALDDPEAFARRLAAEMPPGWPPIVVSDTRPFFARVLAECPASAGWWIWYIVLPEPRRVLIGQMGFKGPPSPEGTVECGYVLLESWRAQGYASEALSGLCDWAFGDPRVQRITGRTYPHLIASIRTMVRNGFIHASGPDEGGIITLVREAPSSPSTSLDSADIAALPPLQEAQ